MGDPALEFVFEVQAEVAAPVRLDDVGGLERRIVPVLGGTVTGPALTGRVLPDGIDWQTIRQDGTAEIEAHYTIEADDGARIHVINPGLRTGPPEVLQRLARGEPVDPGSYYFRTTPRFTTEAPAYRWMTESVFVCQGIRHPAAVIIRFFRVT